MADINFSASSVVSIEEAFSLAENELFSPVFFADTFDDAPLKALIRAGSQDPRVSINRRAEKSLKRLVRYLEEVKRTRVLYGVSEVFKPERLSGSGKPSDTFPLPQNGVSSSYVNNASRIKNVDINSSKIIIGADEVGRGPLAGPLVVCALALPSSPLILGLNDSKKLSAKKREKLSALIQKYALAVALEENTNTQIDEKGIGTALRDTFSGAITRVSRQVGEKNIERVLLDGRPLHIHPKEEAIIKGDACIAPIAAASILAKVARDAFMVKVSSDYPAYGFEKNKGYGSSEHISAIRGKGLCPLHRRSFCKSII